MTGPLPTRLGWPVWRIALVIVVGAFLSMLDGSIVAVGLHTIGHDLHAGLDEVQWVLTAYLIALAVSLPACGWLGRRVGVGRLWLAALAAFAAGSALCALAPGLGWLIGLRVVQGLAAGLLVPAGQTILGQAVGPARLGRVMAVLGIAVSFGPATGPALGGLLIADLSWRWLFGVSVPIAAAGLVAGWRVVPRGEPAHAGTLDGIGLVLAGVGLPALIYAVTAYGELGTAGSARVVVPAILTLATLAAFTRRSLRHPAPLTDLRLLRSRTFAAAGAATTVTGAAMFGIVLLLPLLFQLGRSQSVIATGVSLIGYALGTAVVLPLAGRATDRYGGGAVATAGAAALVITTVPFVFLAATTSPALLQVLLVARGMAGGLAAVPATVAGYAAVRTDQLPDAATQINIMQRVGGATGSTLIVAVLAAALPAGTGHAFTLAFATLTGVAVLALACALALWRAQASEVRSRPAPPAADPTLVDQEKASP